MSGSQRRQTLLPGLEPLGDDDRPPDAPPGRSLDSPAIGGQGIDFAHEAAPAAPQANAGAELPAQGRATAAGATTNLRGKSVYVVDANSLIFQVFHAMPEMTGPRGEPVAAIYGFARDMLFLLESRLPDYLFVAFDRAEPTFRHGMYDQYKAHRSEMPEDLKPQFPAIRRLLDAMGLPVLDLAGYEADDILATVAHQAEAAEANCFLVTADKDCRQLLSERVRMFNIRKNELFDAASLAVDWGVAPGQVVDFQALVGDSVDNVPGVPGIGPKTAQELLARFGTLDALLAGADSLPKSKRRDNLIEFREQALLSRRLVALDRHAPVALDWAAGEARRANPDRIAALFAEFGFRNLGQRLPALYNRRSGGPLFSGGAAAGGGSSAGGGSAASGGAAFSGRAVSDAAGPAGAHAASDSASAAPAIAAPERLDYRIVDTPEKFDRFLAELRGQRRIAVDTETTHLWPRWADIVGYSFSWQDGVAWYLPVRAPQGEAHLDPAATLAALRPTLEDASIEKIGQNLKYDMIVLRAAGARLAGAAFDTMIASYLLDAGERNHSLDELALRYLQHTTTKISELIGSGKQQRRMDEVPVARIGHYAAEDADVTWRLCAPLAERLAEANLTELFSTLEMPLVEVLADLEFAGVKVDAELLAGLSVRFGQRIERVEEEIYKLAGHAFNIGSPKQLAQVLFVEQHLPMLKKTKTGGSTDAEVLEELAVRRPSNALPAKVMEYRQYAKLKSTYVDALPAMAHPRTGRVHTALNQVVAATGRLSSSDPNLQNIPIRTESGREIRAAFVPGEPGWKILAADYSQIELRVLAHFSEDEALAAAFARDEDIHARVASQVYKVPLEGVTREMRRNAKAVNFGVIYGQSPFGLSKQLGIDQAEAASFINAYFDQYPGVEKFLQNVLEECVVKGYVSTILGRRRAVHGVRMASSRQRNLPERTATNTVIQGSAADLIKMAMIDIHRRLGSSGLTARMVLQIHDELMFEVASHEVDALAALVRDEMSGVLALRVPLKVDVKVGVNWAECEPWDEGPGGGVPGAIQTG